MRRARDVALSVVIWGFSEAVFFVTAVRGAYWERRRYGWPYGGRVL